MHGGEIGHGAEESIGWGRRLVWDRRRLVGISAEDGRLRSLLNQHRHLIVSASPVEFVSPLETSSSREGGSAGYVIFIDPPEWVAGTVAGSLPPRLRF